VGTRTEASARPAQRPLLILAAGRPRGSRVRARLIAEAERRAMMVAVLKPADRVRAIDLTIEATHADAVVVCGDAPVQAAAAAVAAVRDLPFACMPAGPEDLLARDLGMPLDDPAEALNLPFTSPERTIDLGEVNGLPFVNRVAVGVELQEAPPPSRAGRRGQARRRTAPARTFAQEGLPTLLVCNNRFELSEDRLGRRDWPDSGRLQVVSFETPGTDGSFASLRCAGFQERVCARFQLALRNEIVVDIDGEPRRLAPPLRFRSVAAALRVRTPSIAARASGLARARGVPELESLQTG
jgi:diacylglycerol kinase family enzyme